MLRGRVHDESAVAADELAAIASLRYLTRILSDLANSARRFRFGGTASCYSISTAAFATRSAKSLDRRHARPDLVGDQRFRQRRVCACVAGDADRDRRGASRSSGPNLRRPARTKITLAQLLSHQAGLAALDEHVECARLSAVIDALEKQKPNWPPGSAHGYHARTFGFLLDELVQAHRAGNRWANIGAGFC